MSDAVSTIAVEKDNRPLRGILFLILATTLFPIQDVIIKNLSGEYAVHQIVFLRGLFAIPFVTVIAWADGAFKNFQLGPIWLQALRAAAGFTSYLVYYMALATIGGQRTAWKSIKGGSK